MNPLLFWALQRMAANPTALFWERELAERFPDAFLEAQQAKFLRQAAPTQEGDLYDRLPGPVLTIMAEGDGFVGTDEDDPEHVPVPLSVLDLQRCRVDLNTLASALYRKYELGGTPRRVHSRVYYLGEFLDGRIAVLLGLLQPTPQSAELLAGLSFPSLLGTRIERFILLSPLGTFGMEEGRRLQARDVVVVPVPEDLSFDPGHFDEDVKDHPLSGGRPPVPGRTWRTFTREEQYIIDLFSASSQEISRVILDNVGKAWEPGTVDSTRSRLRARLKGLGLKGVLPDARPVASGRRRPHINVDGPSRSRTLQGSRQKKAPN